ncbi:rod shape-determining protein MreC [Thermincola ferriacetica]|uniref:Cell shape-determining protein MreC n=1 Tax=Thermincola ferriacetica TaxID=281456 RepID=A0A0L6W276_9FIRM|nr:rod shape-determining protein MreC [Thermincola ferriacetica]KNZ69566.1 rod shape-determining protein MreC [Thermincola ferriacetica]
MFRYLFNRYTMGVLVVVIGVLVLIHYTSFDRQGLTKAEEIVKDLISPIQAGVMKVTNSISGNMSALLSFGKIKKENDELKKQIAELQKQNNLLKEYEYQNLRLREMLDFKDSIAGNYQLVAASVIGHNPSNWFKVITLNRGNADGIKKDMAVVTDKGLVGRIINVAEHSSDVLLILDNNSAVGGIVQVTRTPGVVEGLSDNSGYVRMIHIPKDAPIRENQVVVSSGLGGIFPKGLPIGRVVRIQTQSNGLVKVALIRPFVDFNRLEEVFIIKQIFAPETSGLAEGE